MYTYLTKGALFSKKLIQNVQYCLSSDLKTDLRVQNFYFSNEYCAIRKTIYKNVCLVVLKILDHRETGFVNLDGIINT